MPPLRVGLTISGAVSLGAYEGGALAAFLLAAQTLEGDLLVDAVSGASAGAITGVLVARCLLRGADPIAAMRAAWVDLPSADQLATHEMTAPLDGAVLTRFAREMLDSTKDTLPDGPAGTWRQTEPVRMTMAIVPLGGFGYRISEVEGTTTIDATTFLDWCSPTLDPTSSDETYLQAASAALASGANAVGFAPRLFEHPPDELDEMRANGILNLPGPGGVWYTDGGTVDNEPLGRLLDVVAEIDDVDDRVFLIVHPFAESAPGASRWTDPDHQPRWLPTAHRAYSLRSVQGLYDDIQSLMKVNSRLRWVDDLSANLGGAIEAAAAQLAPADADALRSSVREALETSIVEIGTQRDALDARIGRQPSSARAGAPIPAPETAADAGPTGAAAGPVDLTALVRSAIHRAAGLSGKEAARVEIVSPALDPSGRSSDDLLAGEKLGHFFGFLDVRFRQSDFELGYGHMRAWLVDGLPRYGFGAAQVTEVLAAVDAGSTRFGWAPVDMGGADLGDLTWPERGRGAEILAHAVHLFEKDLRHWSDDLTPTPDP